MTRRGYNKSRQLRDVQKDRKVAQEDIAAIKRTIAIVSRDYQDMMYLVTGLTEIAIRIERADKVMK